MLPLAIALVAGGAALLWAGMTGNSIAEAAKSILAGTPAPEPAKVNAK